MRNKIKTLDPPYKLTVPPYKLAGDNGCDSYVVKLNSHVLGFPETDEELERALNMITRALQLTGAQMED